MNDCVLISIKPNWCNKIVSGQKTVEVRRTRPKIGTPFKAYIYCTRNNSVHDLLEIHVDGKIHKANGNVIGEFICRGISMEIPGYKDHVAAYWNLFDGSCLTADELMGYGKWKILYGWDISDLVIYDKPKELREFERYPVLRNDAEWIVPERLKRPPKSWCYVEELQDGLCETETLPVLW